MRTQYPPNTVLTSKIPIQQSAVLEYVDAELAAGRSFPTIDQIADHMGWKQRHSARDCLRRMWWRGLVLTTENGGWIRTDKTGKD